MTFVLVVFPFASSSLHAAFLVRLAWRLAFKFTYRKSLVQTTPTFWPVLDFLNCRWNRLTLHPSKRNPFTFPLGAICFGISPSTNHNFLSGMHVFWDNEVLLPTGNDVILISPLGGVSHRLCWRNLKEQPQFHNHGSLTHFAYLLPFRSYSIFYFGW